MISTVEEFSNISAIKIDAQGNAGLPISFVKLESIHCTSTSATASKDLTSISTPSRPSKIF